MKNYTDKEIINFDFIFKPEKKKLKEDLENIILKYHEIIKNVMNILSLNKCCIKDLTNLLDLLDELDRKNQLNIINEELLNYIKEFEYLSLKEYNQILLLLLKPHNLYKKDCFLYYKDFMRFFPYFNSLELFMMPEVKNNCILKQLEDISDTLVRCVRINLNINKNGWYFNFFECKIFKFIAAYFYLNIEKNNDMDYLLVLLQYFLDNNFIEECELNGIIDDGVIANEELYIMFFDNYIKSLEFGENNDKNKQKKLGVKNG